MSTIQGERIWPKKWRESVYVGLPIPKKGDAGICSNNSTLAWIYHASKVMLNVIRHRLDRYMNRKWQLNRYVPGKEEAHEVRSRI